MDENVTSPSRSVLESPISNEQNGSLAIVIVHFNQPEWLRACLRSVEISLDRSVSVSCRILIVDNASTHFPIDEFRTEFPQVEFLQLSENRGFAGGNNAAWKHLQESPAVPDYLVLLNPDTLVDEDWLRSLIARLAEQPEVAAVQPLITLHPKTELINTAGNDCHYLGFGLMRGFGRSIGEVPAAVSEIASVSGAAVMFRTTIIEQVGLFDERYFLYLEDTELSWRLRLAGHRIELVPESRVAHRHTYQAPWKHYGYLERNRWWLLLAYYRWRSLLVLLPMLLLMDAGQWLFAVRHGLCRQRVWAAWQVFRPGGWGALLQARRRVQQLRCISDRELTAPFVSEFPATLLPGFLVQRIANPLCKAYWSIARRVIWW